MKATLSEGVREVLDRLGYGEGLKHGYTEGLGQSWASGNKSARKEGSRALDAAGLTINEITAKTLEHNLDSFERLDRMLASAEARRNNALREIDRHRSAVGTAVRQAIDEAEDVEFRDVETREVIAGAQTGRVRGGGAPIKPTPKRAPVPRRGLARLVRPRTRCGTA